MNEIIELIKEREIGKCVENASMKKYTTYKVGGVARCIVYPKDTKKFMQYSFQYANHSKSVSGLQKNSNSICSNSR